MSWDGYQKDIIKRSKALHPERNSMGTPTTNVGIWGQATRSLNAGMAVKPTTQGS